MGILRKKYTFASHNESPVYTVNLIQGDSNIKLSFAGILWGIYALLLVGSCFSSLRFSISGFWLHPCYIMLPVIFFLYQSSIWHFLCKFSLPGTGMIALFVIMLISSLINSASIENLKDISKWIVTFVIMILSASTIQRREDIIFVLKCSIISLSLTYLVGIVHFISCGDYYLNPFQGVGTKNTVSNYSAAYLAAYFFFALIFPLSKKERILFGICLLITIYGQVLTYSRMGLLLIVIAFATVLLYKPRLKLILILIPLIIIFYVMFPKDRSESLSNRYKSLVAGEETKGDQLRLFYGKKATAMAISSPLLGRGPGSFASITSKLYVPEIDFNHQKEPAHNIYLQIIAEYGFLGLIAFLVFIISSFVFLLKSFLKTSSEIEKQLGFILLIGVLLVIIRGNFSHEIFFMPNVSLFFGLSLNYALNKRNNMI